MKYFILLVLSLNCFAIKNIRSEINRFRLLKDRSIIDRELLSPSHQSFFELDLNISSGLKDLIGDISTSTDQSSESDQITETNKILGKNVNTEKFLQAYVELGVPLPYIRLANYDILPSLFGNFSVGTSISINNQLNALAPEAKVYLQKEMNYGVSSLIRSRNNPEYIFKTAFYMSERSDLDATKNATAVATDNDLISLDEIKKVQKDYVLDFGVTKQTKTEKFHFEVKDLRVLDAGSEVDNKIGNAPLFHFNYSKTYELNLVKLEAIYGVFHRQKYSVFDGLYAGFMMKFTKESPLRMHFKIDTDFLSYRFGTTFKHFKFFYGIKTPYSNPQEDMWVSAIHQIHLSVPF